MALIPRPSKNGALVLGSFAANGDPVPVALNTNANTFSAFFTVPEESRHLSVTFRSILSGAADVFVGLQGANVPDANFFTDISYNGQVAVVGSAALSGTQVLMANAVSFPAYVRVRVFVSTAQTGVAFLSVS